MIPRERTGLVGRERELSELEALLFDRSLLTLRGPGGSGKTRLAVRLARRGEQRLEDGALWVELAALRDPIGVGRAVCAALGLEDPAAMESEAALRSHLRDRRLLLVLDNCEHLIDACAELVSALLSAAPDLRILTTSREPLHVPGETVWLVPSLAIPDDLEGRPGAADLDAVLACESVQLFAARAADAMPGFRVSRDNASAVAEICRRVEGIPLAIELCATHVRTLPPAQIARRLDRGLPLPASRGRMGVSRHRTLEATIEWSHDLLTDAERTLFRRLAVFDGAASLESVEAVCAGDGLDGSALLDVLAALIDKSLVVMQEQTGAARYRLLEPIRRFAEEKLRASGDEERTRARHTARFLRLAEDAAVQLRGGARRLWLARLKDDADDLRAGWDYALAASDTPSAHRYAGALFWFWHFGGQVGEGRERSEAALTGPDDPTPARAGALYAAGALAWMQGDFQTARLRLEASVAIARDRAEPVLLLRSLRELGNVWMFQGDAVVARDCYEESVALARENDERWDLALSLTMLGDVLEPGDGSTAANAAFRESEAIFREIGDGWGVALTLFSLALTAARAGDHAGARRYASESLALRHAEGDPWNVAEGLTLLGELAHREGNHDAAGERFREALSLYGELGDRAGVSLVLHGLAAVLADAGESDRAARLFGASEALDKAVRGRSPYTLATPAERAARVQALRDRVGDERFVVPWAEGHALSVADATSLAMSPPVPVESSVEVPADTAELRVRALGEPGVQIGDRVLRPADWSFAKPKELLYYLLCHRPMTKEEIGLDFWPEASTDQLRGRFRTTLHSLRRALGSSARVVFEDGRYTVNRALPCTFDVEVFRSRLAEAGQLEERVPEEAIHHLEAAADIYRGDFLAGMEVGRWASSFRDDLRRSHVDTLTRLGRLHFGQARYEEAAQWYRRALANDELLETAHAQVIRCYARLGQRGRALRHFDAVVALVDRELESHPGDAVLAVAERVRRGEPV